MTHSIFSWFNKKGYAQGATWSILAWLTSSINDALTKAVGDDIPGIEVAFLRFFFGVLALLPFMIAGAPHSFKTVSPKIHAIRSILLVAAIAPWCYGVAALPLTLATTISFTIPLFILVFASLFLKEKVDAPRWIATIAGFIGILISAQPSFGDFNPMVAVLLLSAVMFSTLDIINKKMLVKDEGMLPMLFYSAIGTALLSVIPALMVWKTPTLQDLLALAVLGAGSNLILYCLLRAFHATDVSSIQPFRYIEFIFSGLLGFVVFNELPSSTTLLAAFIIVPATFYISYHESRRHKTKQKNLSEERKAA